MRRSSRRSGPPADPHYITARYPARCARCGADIPRGARIFYYPASRSTFCELDSCSGQAARDFEAARQDEAIYNGGGF